MVSVALLTRDYGGPLLREDWTRNEYKMARRAACAALDGVGVKNTDTTEDETTVTIIRRLCRDGERRRVLERYVLA